MTLELEVPTAPARPAVTQPEQRAADGRAARRRLPRSAAGEWAPAEDRQDPVDILLGQCVNRVPDLVPIRFGRMSESAFAFYRGAAAVMAADLAPGPTPGSRCRLCGDAHLANFGGFASPERSLVFDINDFDETLPGPFEWDVKRLVASFEIAARPRPHRAERDAIVCRSLLGAYCQAMAAFAAMGNLDLWYARARRRRRCWRRFGAPRLRGPAMARFERVVRKAREQGQPEGPRHADRRGRRRAALRERPTAAGAARRAVPGRRARPTIRARSCTGHSAPTAGRSSRDRRHLARAVPVRRPGPQGGGRGQRRHPVLGRAARRARTSTTRCSSRSRRPRPRCCEPYLGPSGYPNQGQRVVEGQRLTQAASDIFLGWQRVAASTAWHHDYYFRQLWDWKALGRHRLDGRADLLAAYAQALRVDARPGPRPLRRRRRHRRLRGLGRRFAAAMAGVRGRLRRPERGRPPPPSSPPSPVGRCRPSPASDAGFGGRLQSTRSRQAGDCRAKLPGCSRPHPIPFAGVGSTGPTVRRSPCSRWPSGRGGSLRDRPAG